jgi:hypothetical protein
VFLPCDITEMVTFLPLAAVFFSVQALNISQYWFFCNPVSVALNNIHNGFWYILSFCSWVLMEWRPFIDLADYEERLLFWHRNLRRFTVLLSFQRLCLARLHPRFGTYLVVRRGRKWVAKSDCWHHVSPSVGPPTLNSTTLTGRIFLKLHIKYFPPKFVHTFRWL